MSFIAELRRRNVIRMAGLYLVGAWLMVQVASTLMPAFALPDWTLRGLVLVLALGFVPALVFAWVFEITPEGLKRDAEVPLEHSIAPQTARRMDRLIIVGLALALGYFAIDKFALAPARETARNAAASAPRAPQAPAPAAAPASASVDRKSIAVLPFSDLSPDHDQEYFSDGMAEEILDALAQVKDLKVAGRTSSFYFKGRNETLKTIGEALGVAHVLEGSVRKQGDKVRITAQLIQTSDGFHLWSDSYDGDLSDVFDLQERIARAITGELKVILHGEQQVRLAPETTDVPVAHQHFLRGRYFWIRRGLRNLQAAESAFEAALAADPDYADAWAGLAQTYALIPEYSVFDPDGGRRLIDTSQQALDAADRALKLDPRSSRALSARAYVRCVNRFDWTGAEDDYRAAIALDPREPSAHQWYAELLTYQRRFAEARVQFDLAIALDPLAPVTHMAKALADWYRGDREAASSGFEESLKLAPDLYYAKVNNALVLAELQRFDQARSAASSLPDDDRRMMERFIGAKAGEAAVDDAVAQIMAHGPGGVPGKPLMLALLGERERALVELERLFAEQDPLREFLYAIPQFEPLHADPRFKALLRQIGLPRDGAGR